jgi:hypothetical protein
MRRVLALGAALALALGCATSPLARPTASAPAGETGEDETAGAAAVGAAAETEPEPKPAEPSRDTFRIGFWELDLFALDFEPKGVTARLFDIRFLRLLEIGSGDDYHSVAFLEMPGLLHTFTTRREGIRHEQRLADVEAFAVAPLRYTRDNEEEAQLHVMKLPVLGSLVGFETEPGVEHQTYLYLLRRDVESLEGVIGDE